MDRQQIPAKNLYTVYADFNCPFCHALNERLHTLELADRVEWRSIQHAPSVQSSQCTFESLSKLTEEVCEVRRRIPATEVALPTFRPNTALPSAVVSAVMATDRRLAVKLRRRIYQALWVEGRDISNPEVLGDLLNDMGIGPVEVTSETKEWLSAWQSDWESGPFKRNIPITLQGSERTLTGLPVVGSLDTFLLARSESEQITPGAACIMAPAQQLLVLDRDPDAIRQVISMMRDCEIRVAGTPAELVEKIDSFGAPNVILLDQDTAGEKWRMQLLQLRADERLQGVPIIVTGERDTEQAEAAAFEAQADDFIAKPYHLPVLSSRLSLHLEMERSKELLRNMARLDRLTAVFNRREFDLRLQLEWNRCIRSGTALSLLMIDVDHFKEYNDNFGHGRGDDCLRHIARILQGCPKRPADLLARYGGEEFAVILPDCDESGALAIAERMRLEIERAAIEHAPTLDCDHVTVSVGGAFTHPSAKSTPESLLETADGRLYAAKRSGRNRVVLNG